MPATTAGNPYAACRAWSDRRGRRGRKPTSCFFIPLGLHLLGMMIAEALERFACRHVRPRIGEGLVHALPQPVIDGRLLAVEGADGRAHDLAYGGVGPR